MVLVVLAATASLRAATQPEPSFSDTFGRADAGAFDLGVTDGQLGGRSRFGYLPLFPGGPTMPAIGAQIRGRLLTNNGKDLGGVQFCPVGENLRQTRGANIGQDLCIQVDLGVPVGGGHTMAGPYFRSRRAAAGDGVIGGASSGFWVRLWSSGHIDVLNLNSASGPNPFAISQRISGFRSDQLHRMMVLVRGRQLWVRLDGVVRPFTQHDQGGVLTETVTLPASGGFNEGAAGLAFGSEPRYSAGGQAAANLMVWQSNLLEGKAATAYARAHEPAAPDIMRELSRKSDAVTPSQKAGQPLTRPGIATTPPYLLPPERGPMGPMASAPTRSAHSGTDDVSAPQPSARDTVSKTDTITAQREPASTFGAKPTVHQQPPVVSEFDRARGPMPAARDEARLLQPADSATTPGPSRADKPASRPAGQGMRGDFDGDGRLTARDAEAALQMSAGLREESLILDMDGDGRVMSADARLILQGITGAPPPKPPPAADAKPPSRPPPAIATTPARTPPPARSERPAAARQSSPFFVSLQVHFPNNLDKLVKQQGGGSGREAFKRLERELMALDVRAVQYKADDSPLILHFRGSSTTAYSPEMFSPGDPFSAPVTIEFRGKTTHALKGALLLKCAGVFTSEAQLLARHANVVLADNQPKKSSGSEVKPLFVETAQGTFSRDDKLPDGSIRVSGGPLVKGWSDQAKRENLQLAAQIAALCAAETALLGAPAADKKLACLRRFRDQTLASSDLGRTMIRFYYDTFSPWAAGLMHQRAPSRALFRAGVELAVAGIETLTELPPAMVAVFASVRGIGP